MTRRDISHHYATAYGKLKLVIVAFVKKVRITRGDEMKALDVASYFVQLANDTPEHDLTNLKLQKLLYYAQGKYLARNDGQPLFDDKVEAWQYGPVVAEAYHAFKACGNFPVTVFDISYRATPLSDQTKQFVAEIWESIGRKYSGSYLVGKTHANGTPWKMVFNESDRNIEIPRLTLQHYFSRNTL